MAQAARLRQAQRIPGAVKTWALAVLGDLIVPDSSPVAGITSPTVSQAEPVADAILAIPDYSTARPMFTSLADWQQLQAEQARNIAIAILGVIPREPAFVNFAEIVSSLADAAGSMGEWANARQLQTQLLDAARETGEELEEILDDVARKVKDNVNPGAAGFGAGLIVALLAVVWLTS